MSAAIETRDLWRTYEIPGGAPFHALKGVSVSVAKGEYVAIMGPSGSGKSTLLQLLGSLDAPTKGDVLYDGVSTRDVDATMLARVRGQKLGFVFQSFNLVPRVGALDNVLLPMSFLSKGKPRAARLERARGLLAQREHLPGEGLVDFEQVHVGRFHAGSGQRRAPHF